MKGGLNGSPFSFQVSMTHSLLQPKRALDAVNEQLLNQSDPHDPRAEEYNSPFAAKGTEYDPNKTGAAADPLAYIKLAEAIAPTLEYLASIAPKGSDIQAFAEVAGPDLREFVTQARSQEKSKLLSKHMGRFRGSSKQAEEKPGEESTPYELLKAKDFKVSKADYAAIRHRSIAAEEAETSLREALRHIGQYKWGTKDIEKAIHVLHNYAIPVALLEVLPERGPIFSSKRAEIEMHSDPKVLPPRNDIRTHLDEDVKKEMDEDRDFKQI